MPRHKLDASFCRTALCELGKRKTDYWDTVITGFVLECRSSGGKTYYLRYFDDQHTQKQHKIGRYEDITFEKARKRAQELRSDVVLGGDPAAKKAERKAIPTYGELADQHIAFAKTYQKRAENTESVINLHLRPRWGKLRLNEIKQQDIAKWLAEKREAGLAPATVEKLRTIFSRSWELAARWGMPGSQVNPVRTIPRPRFSNARQRYLSDEEAKRLHKAVAASSNPQLSAIIGLLLLTGARRTELLTAQWKDVDLERQAWFLPDSKTGKSRFVPLSKAAIDIIRKLPTWPDVPWLIPNPETKQPFVTIKRAWETARNEAGLPGLRLHDLRHSAASLMANSGIDLYTIGQILGHADHKSTQRYSHLAGDTLQAAAEAGAAKLNFDWAEPTHG